MLLSGADGSVDVVLRPYGAFLHGTFSPGQDSPPGPTAQDIFREN